MTDINLFLVALFVALVMAATSICALKNRWKALLAISVLFYYMLIGSKILVVLLLTGVTYSFGLVVYSKKSKLWMPLILLLIPLIIFKSTSVGNHFDNHRIQTLDAVDWVSWSSLFQILGLSYFTFNAISYLMDVKRKYLEPQRNFFLLLLYLLYFPTVFSGPLHRAKYMFEQFKNISVTDDSISKGLRLILWALFKNMVIAQRIFMQMIQLQDSQISGSYYLLVGLMFFLYLYCNFSSFIDFFQGISQLLNIKLKDNFRNRVYLSPSRQEFWRGWHITLNEWFRDYFFFVISKYDRKRKYTDYFLLITFLLIALWHEFSLVLLIWGSLNGLWIVIEKKVAFKKWRYPKIRKVAGVIYHLLISSVLALVFISPGVDEFYRRIIITGARLPDNFLANYLVEFLIIIVCLFIMDFHYARAKNTRIDDYLGAKPKVTRWFIYFKLAVIVLVFGLSAGIENYYIQF